MNEIVNIMQQLKAIIFDFDGVFTDNMVYVFDDGREAVRCSRSDGLGLNRLKKRGIKLFVLSTETNPVVTQRMKKLGIECIQGSQNKKLDLDEYLSNQRLNPAKVAFIGNDINDLECLKAVGLSVAVADAYPEVKKHCKLILKKAGGHGAVREFCDLVWDHIIEIKYE